MSKFYLKPYSATAQHIHYQRHEIGNVWKNPEGVWNGKLKYDGREYRVRGYSTASNCFSALINHMKIERLKAAHPDVELDDISVGSGNEYEEISRVSRAVENYVAAWNRKNGDPTLRMRVVRHRR